MRRYSPHQFALFRIIFGLYLSVHFFQLIPYATELWSRQGLLPDASYNLTYGFFPNILAWLDGPLWIKGFVIAMLVLSLGVMLGIKRRLCALLLWYGWACLFHRNNFILNPGMPFVGWLLLALALLPSGEPWGFDKRDDVQWEMPQLLFGGAWLIMAVSYSISGIDKLGSPSWLYGDTMRILFENPLARDTWLRVWLLSLPGWLLAGMTYAALALEIAFAPLCLWRRGRAFVWFAMVGMHIGILCTINFTDLTLGVLMIHLFTFDTAWLPNRWRRGLKEAGAPTAVPIATTTLAGDPQ